MDPSLEELRELSNAAEEFKKAAPWKWMFDNDIFAVQNPETSENAYISIMCNGEEHYGVAGYLGGEGLYSLDRVMYDADKDIDVALMQKCLMCSFLSRDMLRNEDYQIIKDLGLKPRGKNAWAEFKIYEPGLYPWFINASQCRFMTHILRQALIVSQEVRDDKSRLEPILKNNLRGHLK